MENNNDQKPNTPNYTDPLRPTADAAPSDPSNTSHIGQKVEQGVISKKAGISDQSAEWEDKQESAPQNSSIISPQAEKYIKDPSPEEVNHEENEEEADNKMG